MEFISLLAVFLSIIKTCLTFYFYKEPLSFRSLLGQNFILGSSAVLFIFSFVFLVSLSDFHSIDHEYLMRGGRVKPKQIYFACQTSSL